MAFYIITINSNYPYIRMNFICGSSHYLCILSFYCLLKCFKVVDYIHFVSKFKILFIITYIKYLKQSTICKEINLPVEFS